jgi:hypothetical protein
VAHSADCLTNLTQFVVSALVAALGGTLGARAASKASISIHSPAPRSQTPARVTTPVVTGLAWVPECGLLSFGFRLGFPPAGVSGFRLAGGSSLASAWLLFPVAGRSRALPVPSAPGAGRHSAPGTGRERKGRHAGIRWCRQVAWVVPGLLGRRRWPCGGQSAVIQLRPESNPRSARQDRAKLERDDTCARSTRCSEGSVALARPACARFSGREWWRESGGGSRRGVTKKWGLTLNVMR